MEPTADTNLVKPARGTVPSPLRVSTMDELEYGTVVLRFGRDLPSGTSKVYCKGITLTVPTGGSGADLTIEPSLINTAVSKVEGEAQGTQWWIDRDTTDPNKAVFSFVPETTAVFDGSWAVSFTLSGIEVNSSIGPVDLDIEEMTSTTGAEGSYQKRTGQVKVKKGNDEFFFHSLRPETVVINRGTRVKLLWKAPADPRITYTMYYRKADGTQTLDNVQANFTNQSWTSLALDNNANFTLKATVDGKDYFLTTYLTVNTPNVVVNTLTATSHVTVEAAGTLTTYGPLDANGDVTIKADKTLTVGGAIAANGGISATAVTADGALTANGDVTVAAGKALIVKTIKSPENHALTIENMPTANPANKVKINFDNGVLAVTGNETYSGAISTISISASEITGRGPYAELSLKGIARIGDLRGLGDNAAPVVVNSPITATKTLTASGGISATTLTASGQIAANGSVVVNGPADGGVANSYLWIKNGARLDTEAGSALNVYGALGILHSTSSISGRFKPPTDGLVIGFGNGSPVHVKGGGLTAPTTMSRDTKDSIVVPVRRGNDVWLEGSGGGWRWIPFGGRGPAVAGVQSKEGAEPTELGEVTTGSASGGAGLGEGHVDRPPVPPAGADQD
ncbi:hypothetical protein [Saccharothrix sp. ST-888]|uniref:hypothetical protein n=1 Tax=Saccharothrix sp. ST-888 TaxID=1427391 RepID=UPI0005ECBE1E|nr:hypothetical protein [Saccharothrix sp. ST-888]KJK55493.1 hypothetical protein UK12_28275 [Saccharothrix sp. ST-888]